MIHCQLQDIYKPKYVLLWMGLALEAGFLNTAGFLATGSFVSHVTGVGSQMGVAIGHDDYLFGAELLLIPLMFIIGASIPAWMLESDHLQTRPPKYYQVQAIVTLTLLATLVAGMTGMYGDFSTKADDIHDIFIACSLSFVCGIKNALSVWGSYGKIRTTHLTGLSTDIGLNIPKLFRRLKHERFPEERRVNAVRVLTFFSFTFGSLVSAILFPRLGFEGFICPVATSIVFLVIAIANYQNSIKQSYETVVAKRDDVREKIRLVAGK